jgi:hypothetical protein
MGPRFKEFYRQDVQKFRVLTGADSMFWRFESV